MTKPEPKNWGAPLKAFRVRDGEWISANYCSDGPRPRLNEAVEVEFEGSFTIPAGSPAVDLDEVIQKLVSAVEVARTCPPDHPDNLGLRLDVDARLVAA